MSRYVDTVKLLEFSRNGILPNIEDIEVLHPNVTLLNFSYGGHRNRVGYVTQCSFSIITEELLAELYNHCKGKRVIEIGAGTGYLAYWMKKRFPDLDYKTLDEGCAEYFRQGLYQQGKCTPTDFVTRYGDFDFSEYDVVISSWPDMDCTEIHKVLEKLNVNCTFIYCGESIGGCTGTHEMFDVLDKQYKYEHRLKNSISFNMIMDVWRVYTKLEKEK